MPYFPFFVPLLVSFFILFDPQILKFCFLRCVRFHSVFQLSASSMSSFFQIIMNESGTGVIKQHPNEDIPGLDLGQSCPRSKATFGFIFQAHISPLRAGFPHTGVWTEGPCTIWEFILFLPVHQKFNIYTQVCASKGESLFLLSVSMILTKTILKPALGTEQIPVWSLTYVR